MKNVRDKYSKAIRFLRAHPDLIFNSWAYPHEAKGGCLFYFASSDTHPKIGVGCLTMIARDPALGSGVEGRPDLTRLIQADKYIRGLSPRNLTVSHLKHYARWQRILDKEIRQPILKTIV